MDQLLGEMGWFLFNVRRLEPPEAPPRAREISRAEARRLLDRRLTAQGARERLAAEQRLYAFLGLVTNDLDLYQLHLDIAAEQSPAWHQPASNEIQVVPTSETTGVREALLLAYAYGFLLQERYFGLSTLLDDDADRDRRLALDALSVGDASVSMTLYGTTRFPTVGPTLKFSEPILNIPIIRKRSDIHPTTRTTCGAKYILVPKREEPRSVPPPC